MAKEKETPTGEKEQQGRGGGRQGLHLLLIEEGKRAPASEAAHSRNWATPGVALKGVGGIRVRERYEPTDTLHT